MDTQLDSDFWKRTTIALLLTWLGSFINLLAVLSALGATFGLANSPGGGSFDVGLGSGNPAAGFFFAVLALILLAGSFWIVNVYPKFGRREAFAAFLALISYLIGAIIAGYIIAPAKGIYDPLNLDLEVGAAISIAVLLLFRKSTHTWRELIGLGLGLTIGIILYSIENPVNSIRFAYGYSWIWLSAVFFSELFSHRSNWRVASIWIILMMISPIPIFMLFSLLGIS